MSSDTEVVLWLTVAQHLIKSIYVVLFSLFCMIYAIVLLQNVYRQMLYLNPVRAALPSINSLKVKNLPVSIGNHLFILTSYKFI